MYKVQFMPYYLCNFFSNNPSTYNLRQSDFKMPRFNSVKYGKHTIQIVVKITKEHKRGHIS